MHRGIRTIYKLLYRYDSVYSRAAFAMLTLFVQPLMDNLQSITYQTFEQDPVKYRNYEEVCRIVSHVVYFSKRVGRRYTLL